MQPGLALAGLRLAVHARPPPGASRVASISLRIHAAANTPVEWMAASFARFTIHGSLPRINGRSASTSPFSGPAQRSLHVAACMLVKSPTWPSTPKASAASLPPRLLRLLPAGAKVAGWDCLPL